MEKKDILKTIKKHDCFMAHCYIAHNQNETFYERLNYTIKEKSTNELFCSTIEKGDTPYKNYFGSIGFIIEPENILFSSPGEARIVRLLHGELIFDDEIGIKNPTLAQFEDAIDNRDTCNEFIVSNYEVTGIFLSQDDEGWPMAMEIIEEDFRSFYNKTKSYKLNYYFLLKGILTEIVFNETSRYFEEK